MEAALAAAAVKRQKKRAAEISAGAQKTEQDRQQKASELKVVKEQGLDEAAHEAQAKLLNQFEEERNKRISLLKKEAEEQGLDEEQQKLQAQVYEQIEQERKKRTEELKARIAQEAALDEEAEKAKAAAFAQLEEERKAKLAAAQAGKEEDPDWLDKEKAERIKEATQRAEQERLAKLHKDDEKAHEWDRKKLDQYKMGQGPKPPAFQAAQNYESSQESRRVSTRSRGTGTQHSYDAVPQFNVITDANLTPNQVPGTGPVRKFEQNPAKEEVHKPTTSQASKREGEMDGITQYDLKKHAREIGDQLPEPGTAEHNPDYTWTQEPTADPIPVNAAQEAQDLVSTKEPEVKTEVREDGAKVITTTTTYTTTTGTTAEPKPQCCNCCVIL